MRASESLLCDLTRVLLRSVDDPGQCISEALRTLIQGFPSDRITLFLLDARTSVLRPVRQVTVQGESEAEGENFLHLHHGCVYDRVMSGSAVREHRRSDGWRQMLGRLADKGTPLGLIKCESVPRRAALSRAEQSLFIKACEVLSRGFSSALQRRDMGVRLRRYQELFTSGGAVLESNKLSETVKLALSHFVSNVGYDRAQIFFLDVSGSGYRESFCMDLRGVFTADSALKSVPIVAQEYLRRGSAGIVASRFSTNLVLSSPIECRGNRIGILVVDNLFSRRALTPDDAAVIEILAKRFAVRLENARMFEQFERLAISDSLTALYNHRYFYDRLATEISRAGRYRDHLALLMIDIDHFKNFNDTFGHQAGDTVLRTVADIVRAQIRAIDIPFRYGGEEFAVILPRTDCQGARQIAGRIHEAIARHPYVIGKRTARITVSIGLVCYPEDATLKSELVRKADLALYWVKYHGRNGVCDYAQCGEFELGKQQ